MFSRSTEKFHKINEQDIIVEEKFTSVFRIFGMKFSRSKHSYNCDVEGGKNKLGFQPETR